MNFLKAFLEMSDYKERTVDYITKFQRTYYVGHFLLITAHDSF